MRGGRSRWMAAFPSTLLQAPSLEEAGIGGVLLDVGGVALLSSVDFTLACGRILVRLGVVTRALVTAVGRRHWWHFVVARHLDLRRYCRDASQQPLQAIPPEAAVIKLKAMMRRVV